MMRSHFGRYLRRLLDHVWGCARCSQIGVRALGKTYLSIEGV